MSDQMIGYGHQQIDESDLEAVIRVLQGDFLTQGPAVAEFERALCEFTGAAHAVAVSSGSSALWCAYAALGIDSKCRVWVPSITFVATANAAAHLGAEIEFLDVDPDSGNLCLAALHRKLQQARRLESLPDLVVPVHLTGNPCDMAALRDLATEFRFRLVEDACHALGAYLADGSRVGSSHYSEATCFSFHPVKSITCGEGGAVMCNDAAIAERLQALRHNGISRNPGPAGKPVTPAWNYEQHRLGMNARLSDLNAALGRNQLRRLDHLIDQRRRLAMAYHQALQSFRDLSLPACDPDSAWHLYAIRFRNSRIRDEAYERLLKEGFRCAVHYPPVHRQPWYQRRAVAEVLPGADEYAARTLSLPLFPGLQPDQLAQVVDCVAEVLATSSALADAQVTP